MRKCASLIVAAVAALAVSSPILTSTAAQAAGKDPAVVQSGKEWVVVQSGKEWVIQSGKEWIPNPGKEW